MQDHVKASRPRFRGLIARWCVCGMALLGLAGDLTAVEKTFSTSAGAWLTSTNWTPSGVPTASDNVLISGGSTVMTLTAGNLTIQNIAFTSSTSRILENSTGGSTASNLTLATVDGSGNLINLNSSGTPTFTIRNGTTANLNLILGASGNFNTGTGASAILAINSNISETGGSRSLTKTGAGLLALSGTNTYTGSTTITAGTLSLGAGGTTGTLSTSSTIANNGNFTINRTNSVTQGTDFTGSAITGTGSLTKSGSGTLTLNAANTYSGDTNLGSSAGTILLANSNAIQNSTLNKTGSTLTFSSTVVSHAFTFGGLSGSSGFALQDNAGSPIAIGLTVGSNNIGTTFSGVLTGPGSLAKVGTGALALSGASTYAGGTSVASGAILELGGSGDVATGGSALASGPVGVGTLTLGNGSTLRSNNTVNRTIQNNLSLSGGVTLGGFTQTGNLFVNSTDGTDALTTPSTVVLTGDTVLTTLQSATINNVISGNFSLQKSGTAGLTLAAANTYKGDTIVTEGTLTMAANNVFDDASDVVVSGGSLSVNSRTDTVNSVKLSGGAAITGGAASNLTALGYELESGSMSARLGGAGTVSKSTSGTVTLSSDSSATFTGNTTINAGTLLVIGNLGSGSVVIAGGVLGGSGTIQGVVTAQAGGTLAPGMSVESLDTGALTFEANSTFSYEIDSDEPVATGADRVNVSGNLVIDPLANLTFVTDLGATLLPIGTVYTVMNYTGTLTGTFAGKPDNFEFTNGLNTYRLNYNVATGGLNFGAASGGSFIALTTVTAVPEASALVLGGMICIGTGLVVVRRKWRARRAAPPLDVAA